MRDAGHLGSDRKPWVARHREQLQPGDDIGGRKAVELQPRRLDRREIAERRCDRRIGGDLGIERNRLGGIVGTRRGGGLGEQRQRTVTRLRRRGEAVEHRHRTGDIARFDLGDRLRQFLAGNPGATCAVLPPIQQPADGDEQQHDADRDEPPIARPQSGHLAAPIFFVDLAQESVVGHVVLRQINLQCARRGGP